MLSVLRSEIASEVPIVGCEITPTVVLCLPNNTLTSDDATASAPIAGSYLKYKWSRLEGKKSDIRCHVHPSEPSMLQCQYCAKHKSLVGRSHHCSTKCYQDAWPDHKAAHEIAQKANNKADLIHTYSHHAPAYCPQQQEPESVVGNCRTYTPTANDIGSVLKLEITVISASTGAVLGQATEMKTIRVVASPTPIPRRLISVCQDNMFGQPGSFTVLSYNILSDTSASSLLYSYCVPWARTWTYRRQNLLKEIVYYGADVVCLQDVQEDHYENFFAPELAKHGYDGHYKRRTNEAPSTGRKPSTIDGCATFFKRDRFTFVRTYDIEFNKSAHALVEASVPNDQKTDATKRLILDNIVFIVVLKPKFNSQLADPFPKFPLICVANTRIDTKQEMKDVLLWHVHTLLVGMEKLTESRVDMPMIVCGDFNMDPASSAHSLVALKCVNPQHQDLTSDPFGILQPRTKLTHRLPLASAYTAFSLLRWGVGLDNQKKSIQFPTKEPNLTMCTNEYAGCHDYIFYTANNLRVEGLLELVDGTVMRKNKAIPSTELSSSHIALLSQFRYIPHPPSFQAGPSFMQNPPNIHV
ncbi:unnamed protein product [Cochlearia groenlandica]